MKQFYRNIVTISIFLTIMLTIAGTASALRPDPNLDPNLNPNYNRTTSGPGITPNFVDNGGNWTVIEDRSRYGPELNTSWYVFLPPANRTG